MKKSVKLTLLVLFTLTIFQCSKDETPLNISETQNETPPETVTDADGNEYNTVKIGDQIWMKENLKTTKYNNGSPIIKYTFEEHGNNWGSLNNQEAFYQWADTNDLNNVVDEELAIDAFGAMYNHWAIETGQLAPEGWRIPTEADFRELETFIANDGNSNNEATALKSTTLWFGNSGNGTDNYGFNGLPNGYINAFGGPTLAHGIATWATTSGEFSVSLGSQTRILVQLFEEEAIIFEDNAIQIGAAIRCIKIQ